MTSVFAKACARIAGLPAALFLLTAASAHAGPVTFAQVLQVNGAQQEWSITTNATGTSTTVSASGLVYFEYSGVSGLPFTGLEKAMFTLNATSTSAGNCSVACGAGDTLTQAGYSGSFSFIDAGSAPGTNLLSGTFAVTGDPSTTGAQFSSSTGGTGGSFDASSTAGNLNQLILTSSFLAFVGETQETASFSLSSLIPNFATGPVSAGDTAFPADGTFNAAGSGTFSSNPGPLALVPEPPAALILGGGVLGLAFLLARKPARRRPSLRMAA